MGELVIPPASDLATRVLHWCDLRYLTNLEQCGLRYTSSVRPAGQYVSLCRTACPYERRTQVTKPAKKHPQLNMVGTFEA